MSPSFSPQQQAFIGTYARLTGLNPGVVSAQVAAEEPVGAKAGYRGTQDWLNVGITNSGPMGANNPAWRNPVKAAQLAAAWATGKSSIPGFGTASSGIVNAVRGSAGKSPAAQIAALQRSGWASSGYPNLPTLYSQYGARYAQQAFGAQTTAFGPSGSAPTGRASEAISIPTSTIQGIGPKTDMQSAIIDSLLRPVPIKANGLPGGGDLLGDIVKRVDSGDYTSPATSKTIRGLTGGLTSVSVPGMPGVSGRSLSGGDVSPLPGWKIGRTDMGVDANAPRVGAPVLAMNDSKVVRILPGWYKGQPLVELKLLAGPNKGKMWYVAEQISGVPKVGTVIQRGQRVVSYAPTGTGIEIGWGAPGGQTEAQATTGYTEGEVTPAGSNFAHVFGLK